MLQGDWDCYSVYQRMALEIQRGKTRLLKVVFECLDNGSELVFLSFDRLIFIML